jgi:hypothetical protein
MIRESFQTSVSEGEPGEFEEVSLDELSLRQKATLGPVADFRPVPNPPEGLLSTKHPRPTRVES